MLHQRTSTLLIILYNVTETLKLINTTLKNLMCGSGAKCLKQFQVLHLFCWCGQRQGEFFADCK